MLPNCRSFSYAARLLALFAALTAVLYSPVLHAAGFNIAADETVTTSQALTDGETGMIQPGGALDVTGMDAVSAGGASIKVGNYGMISTTGDSAVGIRSTGDATVIINAGAMSTTGDNAADAISSAGNNAAVSNFGTITTTGVDAYGIWSTGDAATIGNFGAIETAGVIAEAIGSIGSNATIINNGRITTTGFAADGIRSAGAGATIGNYGMITTTGVDAYGIWSTGDAAAIYNSGVIATQGVDAVGLVSTGDFAAIGNYGAIAATGDGAFGIVSIGDNAAVAHSGAITVSGAGAAGILSAGSNGTITVSGSIMATGSATRAIFGDNNQTLNLLPGTMVFGAIDLGAGTNAVNVLSNGAGPSATMSIANPGTITQSGRGLSFVNGDTVQLVDTTNLTATRSSMGFLSSNIFHAVSLQLNEQLLSYDAEPVVWGRMFGGKRDRSNRDEAALPYSDNTYGMVGGYGQTRGAYRAGIFGGASHSDADTDRRSANIDADSVFAGIYGQYARDGWVLNGVLATGYASYDSKRWVFDNQSGYEKATADYHGVYVSPSVSLMYIYDWGAGLSFRPSAELNYTYEGLSSYDESGTTRSDLSVGSRYASVLNSRLQLAVRQVLTGCPGEVEIRGGLNHTNYDDDTVRIRLRGGPASNYGITGTSHVTGAYLGAGGRLGLNEQLNLVGDVAYVYGGGDGYSLVGYVGMTYRF